jgi:hypothetical protein
MFDVNGAENPIIDAECCLDSCKAGLIYLLSLQLEDLPKLLEIRCTYIFLMPCFVPMHLKHAETIKGQTNRNWLVVWNMIFFSHILGIIIPTG